MFYFQNVKKEIKFPPLIIAFAVFGLLVLFPLYEARNTSYALALLALVAILWSTEAIPLAVTALFIPLLASVLGLATPAFAFESFSNPVIFLFMGGFVLGGMMIYHGVDLFIANKIISAARGNFYRSSLLVMTATSFMSWWVSNTSAAVMMLPMATGLLTYAKKPQGGKESHFLLLGVAYAASVGGIVSIISSPPNAIGAAILKISFTEWLRYSFLLYVISMIMLFLMLTLYFRPGNAFVDHPGGQPLKPPPKKLIFVLLVIVTGWVLEDSIAKWTGITSGMGALVAVAGMLLIFLTRLLSWEQMIESVQWRILLLFGGGLTLGKILETSGLGLRLAEAISKFAAELPIILFIWLLVLFSIMLTEFMSNTASAALLLPVLYNLAIQMKMDPAVLVFPATITASYGFMLPAGTPPNAVAYGTGQIQQKVMLKAGLLLNIVFSVILTVYFYFMLYRR